MNAPFTIGRNEKADGVCILGAGLAGLGAAMGLPGARVFEAKSHVGGHAYSHPIDGFHWDEGAHICHSRDQNYLDLILKAAEDVHLKERSVVRNYWQGSWLGYPVQNNLYQLPIDLRKSALFEMIEASKKNEPPVDYDDWCVKAYGPSLTETFYRPFTRKYWRTETKSLGLDWLKGRLIPPDMKTIVNGAFEEPKISGAVFNSFRYPRKGGYFRFYESLYKGLDVQLEHMVTSIDPTAKKVEFANGRSASYEKLISTLPLDTLVSLVRGAPRDVQERASRLIATQMVCVNLYLPEFKKPFEADWFYIYDGDLKAARVSVPSNLDGSFSQGLRLQAEVFFGKGERIDAASVADSVVRELSHLIGYDASRDTLRVSYFVVPKAYVVSDQKRAQNTDAILKWLETTGISSVGLYGRWEYIWSDAAFTQGANEARALIRK